MVSDEIIDTMDPQMAHGERRIPLFIETFLVNRKQYWRKKIGKHYANHGSGQDPWMSTETCVLGEKFCGLTAY